MTDEIKPKRLQHKMLVHHNNELQIECTVDGRCNSFTKKISDEFYINGVAGLQLAVFSSHMNGVNNGVPYACIYMRFYKLRPKENNLTYKINLNSNGLNIKNKSFTDDDGTWRMILERSIRLGFTFDISVAMELQSNVSPLAPLYEDEELIDFEIRGEEGAIRMHKAVLAAASPVFQRMLCGSWKETSEGHIDVDGITTRTLQDFKDYLYKHTLPSEGLQPLLLLAVYYLIPDLEQKCVYRLVDTLSADNACDLLAFAGKNKVTSLLLAIIDAMQAGGVTTENIREREKVKEKSMEN